MLFMEHHFSKKEHTDHTGEAEQQSTGYTVEEIQVRRIQKIEGRIAEMEKKEKYSTVVQCPNMSRDFIMDGF